MKKFLLSVLTVLTVMSFSGCDDGTPNRNDGADQNLGRIHSKYFDVEIIENLGGDCCIFRDTHTDNLYLCIGGFNSAMAIPIYNEDGTIKKYSQELEKEEKGDK
jgi:hypothetical protein